MFVRYVSQRICSSLTPRIQTLLKPTVCLLLMTRCTSCEDYRAAADIDLEMDGADEKAGRKIEAPLLALWGSKGRLASLWNVLDQWRRHANGPVQGRPLEAGHYLAEVPFAPTCQPEYAPETSAAGAANPLLSASQIDTIPALCRNSLFELNYMAQREKTMASFTPQWGITVFCGQL